MVIYRAKKVRNQQPGKLDGWSSTLCSPDGSAQANICPTPWARTSLSKGSTFETRTDSPTDSLMGPETPWIQALEKNGSRVASSGLTRRGGRKHLAASSPSKKSVTGMSGSKQNIATSRADTDLVNRGTQENSSRRTRSKKPEEPTGGRLSSSSITIRSQANRRVSREQHQRCRRVSRQRSTKIRRTV